MKRDTAEPAAFGGTALAARRAWFADKKNPVITDDGA